MRAGWFAGPALAFVALALLPARAYAHHCDTAQHCFESGQPASAFPVVAGVILLAGLSMAINLNPYTGFARGLYEAGTGRDLMTGDELGFWERVMGTIPVVGRAGSILRTGRAMPRYVDRTIDAFNETSRYLDAASDIRGATGATTGTDPLTGESLSRRERVISGLGAAGADPLAEAIEAYPVRGGGEQLWTDGIREDNRYLQEAKYGGSPENSPFRDDSHSPSPVREKIRQQAEDEVYKYSRIIKDSESPYQGLEYITNDEGAKRFYEELFLKHDVPGHVRVEE